MSKIFNVNAVCLPNKHYMVDLTERLKEIKVMVDRGDYFTINRGRQYGKTTTLRALENYLKDEYIVVRLDFQGFSTAKFENEASFSVAFVTEILRYSKKISFSENNQKRFSLFAERQSSDIDLTELFYLLSDWCASSDKPIVLMIDEVDAASNHQIFLDFLAQLRLGYINRDDTPTFQSVILAGVNDIKNLKKKIRPESSHQANSPWNIAADFLVDMSFSPKDIAGMLQEYENDHATGMDVEVIASLIYDYTSGYPFLVSRICKLLDENLAHMFPDKASAWTRNGILVAVNSILFEKNTLFDSLIDKVESYPNLCKMLYQLLMNGKEISYNPDNENISVAMMYGFVKPLNGKVVIANRIFETRLYNYFLSSAEMSEGDMYGLGDRDKYQFITKDGLDMKLILERFVTCFDELYGDDPAKFLEDDGRRYFLLYLRPIINGTGNYYIESQTRNQDRTDVIVDYLGKQYIIELKLWRGNAYNTRGENQLTDYLDYYHLNKGYMLSFNFNKKKTIGVKEITLGDKVLVEAVV